MLEQKIPDSFNAFIYILDGAAEIGAGKNARSDAHYAVSCCCSRTDFTMLIIDCQMTLTPGKDTDGVTVRASSGRVSFVLLAGQPIGEPVVQQGPVSELASNSQQEACLFCTICSLS